MHNKWLLTAALLYSGSVLAAVLAVSEARATEITEADPLADAFDRCVHDRCSTGDQLTGRIEGFECGDNCYLTVGFADGASLGALCIAAACQPWNEVGAIPETMLGARVTVEIGVGLQHQGGDWWAPFVAFTSVRVER